MEIAASVVLVMDALITTYLLVFFAINFWFVALSAARVRRLLWREQLRPPTRDRTSPFLPPLTLLVPAYNEEVTCIDSVRSLLRLDYPCYEVIICNDGSKDRTVEVLREAFGFVRTDVNYNPVLATAHVRGLYQATCELPPNVKRLVLIDKANGGKADALNAAINAAEGIFVSSMDADSVLEPDALLRAMQVVADDPSRVIAIGTQVGLSNGSVIEAGQVKELRVPSKWIARFQVAEYMRSFTQGRTALGELNSLLILSGVFALMRRDLVIAAGGFLTKHVRGRIVEEYCGAGAHTVCEDMEVVVRLHRYLLDREREGIVTFLPHPAAWTEAPEVYRDLGKQRGRWYRGLLEVLWYHRAMMFRRRYGRIGMFSLPYQLMFEAAAPVIEALGYLMVPLTIVLGLLSVGHALAFLCLAAALNVLLTTASVMLSVRAQQGRTGERALFAYRRLRDVFVLAATGVIVNQQSDACHGTAPGPCVFNSKHHPLRDASNRPLVKTQWEMPVHEWKVGRGFRLRFDFEKARQRLGSVALLSDILEYCENRIHTSSLPDFPGAVNGLQIENNGRVFKVGAAVDAGLAPFQNAVKAGIDFLIVHHGLFWEPAFPITGARFRKYKTCFENNLAVYSAHLPLDCHPEIGNNSLLAQHLGLKVSGQFLDYEGQKIGLLTEGLITRNEIRKRLEGLFPKGIIGIEKGGGRPAKIAIVTGSGGSAIPELAKAGVDTLITGELRQHHFNQAEEAHLNLYACGHYATETFGVSALAKELAERFELDWEFIESDCPL